MDAERWVYRETGVPPFWKGNTECFAINKHLSFYGETAGVFSFSHIPQTLFTKKPAKRDAFPQTHPFLLCLLFAGLSTSLPQNNIFQP